MGDPVLSFLSALGVALSDENVPYVVARRVGGLSCLSAEDDVDLVVPGASLTRVLDVVSRVLRRFDGSRIVTHRFPGLAQCVLGLPSPHDPLTVLRLDLHTSIDWQGLELVPGQAMLDGRVRAGAFWRPSPHAEAVGLLLHDLVAKAAFRAGDLEEVETLRQQEPEGFRDLLRQIMGARRSRQVEDAVQLGDAALLLSFRQALLRSLVARQMGRFVVWRARHLVRLVGCLFRRRGALVVLVGPDGAGKTTLIEATARLLRSNGFKTEVAYFGVRSAMLPTKKILRALHERRRRGEDRVAEQVRSRLSFKKKLAYFLGAVHSYLDQLLRYGVQVYPRLARARIVLCDRYFHDALTAPAPGPLRACLDWTVIHAAPRPDICFVLSGDPARIHDRKPELSVEEIARQQACYRRLLGAPFAVVEVPVTANPGETARRMMEDVLSAFGRRNA